MAESESTNDLTLNDTTINGTPIREMSEYRLRHLYQVIHEEADWRGIELHLPDPRPSGFISPSDYLERYGTVGGSDTIEKAPPPLTESQLAKLNRRHGARVRYQ